MRNFLLCAVACLIASLAFAQDPVKVDAKQVVGDVAIPPRHLLGDLFGERRHLQGHSIGFESFVWEPAAVCGSIVGVRVRVLVGRKALVVERGAPLVGRGVLPAQRMLLHWPFRTLFCSGHLRCIGRTR